MQFNQLGSLLPQPFRGFFLGRLISLLGSSMTPVALALAVLNATGRPTDLGIVLACQLIPQLSLLLVGGAVGDRVARRTVLVAASVGAGLTQSGMAALLITSHYSLLLMACLAAGNGAMEAFASPALRGLVAELVRPDDLQRANSLLATTQNAASILGPTVAGLLVAGVGGGWAIAVDAASFLVSAVFFVRLPVLTSTETSSPSTREGLLGEIRQGWQAFRAIPWVYTMAISFCVINLVNVGPWQVLGPTLTRTHGGDAVWGVVLSMRAAGLLLMSVLMYRLTLKYPLRIGGLIGVLGALPLLALGFGLGAPWVIAFAFVGALGFMTAGIAWDTSLQRHIPRNMLSRISSFDDLLSYGAIPAGQLLVGPLAARWGDRNVMLVCGFAYVLAMVGPLSVQSVRKLSSDIDAPADVSDASEEIGA